MISRHLIISLKVLSSISTGSHNQVLQGIQQILFRNCSLGNSDIDVSVDSNWWRSASHKSQLKSSLKKSGWKLLISFGRANFGYEESYLMKDIKVDLFSGVVDSGKH